MACIMQVIRIREGVERRDDEMHFSALQQFFRINLNYKMHLIVLIAQQTYIPCILASVLTRLKIIYEVIK